MKRFKRGEKGFTLVELLIVVAILGVLAAVVIPNVVGLMGRGGAQAYETDAEVIQLATSTFYSDVHQGWNEDAGSYYWGCNNTANQEDPGHYYPTALAVVGDHILTLSTTVYDPDHITNFRIDGASAAATSAEINDHAIWMGLLVNAPGDGINNTTGLQNRGTVSSLEDETGLYLQEIPESAMHGETGAGLNDERNGADSPGGGYCWVVGKNGTVYGAYSPDGGTTWYSGFSGAYP